VTAAHLPTPLRLPVGALLPQQSLSAMVPVPLVFAFASTWVRVDQPPFFMNWQCADIPFQ